MFIWLFYDISRNKIRGRVAKLCKQAGLKRIQKSVFAGRISRKRLDNLRQLLVQQIRPQTDLLHIQPVNKQDWNKAERFGDLAKAPNETVLRGKALLY
jgi:CRISPR-associated protein Cas2